MSTGYLKRPLADKLGIKEEFKIIILKPPESYFNRLGKLPRGVIIKKEQKRPLDLIHFFTKSKKELEDKFPELKKELSQNGILWISWPRSSSKVETDLNENIIREIGLKNNLVDVKVSAIDETCQVSSLFID